MRLHSASGAQSNNNKKQPVMSLSRNHDWITQDIPQNFDEHFHVGTILFSTDVDSPAISPHRPRGASTYG